MRKHRLYILSRITVHILLYLTFFFINMLLNCTFVVYMMNR